MTAICVLILIISMLCGCSPGGSAAEPVMKDGYYLDTVCSVSVYRMADEQGNVKDAADMGEAAETAIDEAFDLCKDLESKTSRTRKGSDISRINSAGGEWVEVSDYTLELIQKGMEYSHISDGAFDITVGGLTEQWDFHAPEGEAKLPDEESLAEAAKHVNYRNIAIEGNNVRLTDPETRLDLGGIAKGYIGDKMTEVLESKGVVSAVINLGGNVICIGGKCLHAIMHFIEDHAQTAHIPVRFAASKLIEDTDGVEAVFILKDGTTEQTSGMEFEKV